MTAVARQVKVIIQPWLFEMGEPELRRVAAQKEYKRAIDAVLKARRELLAVDQERGLSQINICLESLRSIARLSDTQAEELVLFAIERSGATTETEIAEDSRLARVVVKEVLQNLMERKIIYLTNKFIPGSDRQYQMFKSNRVKTPEVV